MCLPCYNVQILTLSLSLQVYRATQKSPYMWKMDSLFTKHALFGHQNVDSTHGRVSPTRDEPPLTHLVILVHMHL